MQVGGPCLLTQGEESENGVCTAEAPEAGMFLKRFIRVKRHLPVPRSDVEYAWLNIFQSSADVAEIMKFLETP